MPEPLYMTMDERRAVILDYAQRFDIHLFVETGTADGSTTAAMVPHFDGLWTIEIDEALYTHALLLFQNEPKVVPMLGDSTFQLPRVVEILEWAEKPAIFWLDGHYCGGATRGPLDSPVVSELETVLSKAPKGSVILVDDARIFGGMEEEGLEGYTGYPEINYVAYLASAAGRNFLVQDDIIRITPQNV